MNVMKPVASAREDTFPPPRGPGTCIDPPSRQAARPPARSGVQSATGELAPLQDAAAPGAGQGVDQGETGVPPCIGGAGNVPPALRV